MAKGRIPHAQYIQTIDGGGGLSIAIAYAQEILGGEADMFGGLDLRASRLEHPDLHMVIPMVQTVDKTCDSSINSFREYYLANPFTSYKQWLQYKGERNKKAIISKHEAQAVTKKLSLRSFEGGYKVLVMWMAELMNLDCANKLLKLVEEPPDRTVIIMVGNDSQKLLPTIRSRTQVLKLRPLNQQEIKATLKETLRVEEGDLTRAVIDSEGSISQALDLLKEDENQDDEHVKQWMRLCYQRKVVETMAWCDNIASLGRESTISVLQSTLEIFRLAFRMNYVLGSQTVASDKEEFTKKFSPFIHASNAPALMEETEKAITDIQRNGNARIVLLDLSFKVMREIRKPKEQLAI
ncbi:MAG: hypothetical protein HKN45_08105 [Flavobacteriales bacterium]|nr:hypothetical protein [Flavobacteriales bacterium]